jgi:predicted ATPase
VTRRPRVVELVGAPGSGKSSVAAALGELPGVVVVKNHQRLDLPVLAWSAVTAGRVLWATPPRGVSRLRWIAWLGRCRAAPRIVRRRLAAGAEVVVLDQGPVYTLGRLAESASRNPGVARWQQAGVAECGRLLDLVIVLDGEPSLLADRLQSRAKAHRADDLAADDAVTYLERERATTRTIAAAAVAAGATMVDVDAACPLADNIAAVKAVLDAGPAPVAGTGEPA